MTLQEKKLLEDKLYDILKESLYGGIPMSNEADGGSESNNSSDDDNESGAIEKDGLRVVPDGDSIDNEMWNRMKTILPVLQDTNDDSVNSFNLTRSQLAYELWPNVDKDAARSKLSQKIEGNKAWKEWELNKLANIISGNLA